MTNDGTTLWAWVTTLEDGSVSQVGAYSPQLRSHISLVARDREIAEQLRPLARGHAKATGQRVWLREYTGCIDHGDA